MTQNPKLTDKEKLCVVLRSTSYFLNILFQFLCLIQLKIINVSKKMKIPSNISFKNCTYCDDCHFCRIVTNIDVKSTCNSNYLFQTMKS